MKAKSNKSNQASLKKELYIKIIILIILIVLIFITSLDTGRKFFTLKNTYLEEAKGEVNSSVARWEFNAKIILNEDSEN